MTPESQARVNIDRMLEQAGWMVQDRNSVNLYAAAGVAVREFVLKSGHGTADYLLFVNRAAAGVVEAKPEGFTLTGVEPQSDKYSAGLPDDLPAYHRPLPFLYQSTGIETRFTSLLDPAPRSRLVFAFHTPKTLAEWLSTSTPSRNIGQQQVAGLQDGYSPSYSLRRRLTTMPSLDPSGLWSVQERAILNLEESLAAGRPRALVRWPRAAARPSWPATWPTG